jgi:hypothetical protein
MVPHLFRAERTATGSTEIWRPGGPGTRVTAQAHIAGTGAVSGTAKLMATHTPSLPTSWVQVGSDMTLSGTNTAVAALTADTAFTAFRFDVTALSAGAKATLALGRG